MPSEPSQCVDLVVVDDDEILLELVERRARHTPYSLKCFSSPIAALAYLRECPPRVLVLDQRMPELDGLELLRTLQASSPLQHPETYLSSAAELPTPTLNDAARMGARPLNKAHWHGSSALAQLMAL